MDSTAEIITVSAIGSMLLFIVSIVLIAWCCVNKNTQSNSNEVKEGEESYEEMRKRKMKHPYYHFLKRHAKDMYYLNKDLKRREAEYERKSAKSFLGNEQKPEAPPTNPDYGSDAPGPSAAATDMEAHGEESETPDSYELMQRYKVAKFLE